MNAMTRWGLRLTLLAAVMPTAIPALAEPDEPNPSDEELEDARWFSRDELGAALRGETGESRQLSPRLSISRWLVEHWYGSDGRAPDSA